VLVQEQDQIQKPIYFVSKAFGQEAPPLLPQFYSGGDDEPPDTEGIAET